MTESCGFICEQTLFSKESLALPTPGCAEGGLVRVSDLMLQNVFVFCPFSSSSATALRSRHTLITQSSLSQQQRGVSLKYLALRRAIALPWELCAFVCNHAVLPQSTAVVSAVSQGTEISLNLWQQGKTFKKILFESFLEKKKAPFF